MFHDASSVGPTSAPAPVSYRDPTTMIYPNHRNHVYEIAGEASGFLLFNPAIHYWMAIDAAGARIVRALDEPTTLADVRRALSASDAEMERRILPFINTLLEERFVQLSLPADGEHWLPADRSLETPDDYLFEDLIVSLADRCNLACSYCFNAKQRQDRLDQPGTARLTREAIANTAREFKEMGGTAILITGGEPTLNPDFLDICEDAKALGLAVRVITNGTRLDRLDVHRLVEAVETLSVSLDSVDDTLNAQLWQVSKYRSADILASLATIGRTRRQDGSLIDIVIKPTLTRHNLAALPQLFQVTETALAGCTVGFDISGFQSIDDAAINDDLRISRADLEAGLRAAWLALVPKGNDDQAQRRRALAAEDFGLSLGGKMPSLERPKALSCTPSLFVTNTGDVFPCQALERDEFRLGNVATKSLRAAFAHPRFSDLRRTMFRDDIDVCGTCALRYACVEHCHGTALDKTGRTNGFMNDADLACQTRTVRRMWISTQLAGLA